MPRPIEKALIEASNPQTDPDRLQALSEWEGKDERTRIRQAIAANPNSDERLLLSLAAEYPNEVMANSRFQLLLMSAESWWKDAVPLSLLRLLAALGINSPRQARLDFFDQLGGLLADTDPLDMNMEWHMGFTQEFRVGWEACSGELDDTGSEELDNEDDVGHNSSDHDEPEEKDLSVDFSCVVDEVHSDLTPPCSIQDPLSFLEKLIDVNSEGELLDLLLEHGWQKEVGCCGDGYWEIEGITPEEDRWEVSTDLDGDGSGSIQITDPSGETHVFDVDAPGDPGGEYLNPTLNEFPDLVGSIFATDLLSSAELTKLLQQVIAAEKQSQRSEVNPIQAE